MRTRHASLFGRVLAFTSSGGINKHAATPDSSAARGWATNAWLTSDGVVVLNPGPYVGAGLRRRRIAGLSNDQLDEAVPRLHDALTGSTGPIFLVAKNDELLNAVVATASPSTSDAVSSGEPGLWLAGSDVESLARQRTRTSARLVDWTTKSSASDGLERRMATLHDYGIDVLAMPHKDWSPGSIALCHRFGIMSYGWGCEHEREMAALVDSGIDAVQTPFPDRLAAVIDQYR